MIDIVIFLIQTNYFGGDGSSIFEAIWMCVKQDKSKSERKIANAYYSTEEDTAYVFSNSEYGVIVKL